MAAAFDADDARIDMGTVLAAVWRRRYRIAIVTALLLAGTYMVLFFVPKMYESSASILVEARTNSYLSPDGQSGNSGGAAGDDTAIASQIELIQSRDTLLKVIDVAELRNQPELTRSGAGPLGLILGLFGRGSAPHNLDDTILANMQSRLTVIRERNSRIITILFRSESPQLAAKIANTIANVHVSRRAGQVISDTADATKWLLSEIDKMRQRVAEAESKVADFRIKNDLYVVDTGSNSLLDQKLSDISTQITQSQERQSTAKSRSLVLRSMIKAGQPIESLSAVRDSLTIQKLSEQKATLQSQKAERLSTLLPNHPEVQALTAQIAEIDKQITAEGRRIADALDADTRVEAGIEQSLREELARLKITASNAATNGVTLDELVREAKAQRDLLETYLLRYRDASARTDSNSTLPDVRVVSAAAPSLSPASPKTSLILTAVLVMSLAGQIGFILFSELVSGRAIVEAPVAAPRADAETEFATMAQTSQHFEPDIAWQAPAKSPASSAAEPPTAEAPQEPIVPSEMEARLARDQEQSPAYRKESARMFNRLFGRAEPADLDVEEVPILAPDLSEPEIAETREHPRPVRLQAQYSNTAPEGDTDVDVAAEQDMHAGAEQPVALPSSLEPLMDAVVARNERIVLVSHLGDEAESERLVDSLTSSALARGLSVAIIDGSSARRSPDLGLSDLCAGQAGFGDCVHRDNSGQLARVPWGRQLRIDHRSSAAVTLAEALSDIFHFVVISTGRPGLASSLPVFSGIEGYVLVASSDHVDDDTYAGIEADAAALGFERIQIVGAPGADVRVA